MFHFHTPSSPAAEDAQQSAAEHGAAEEDVEPDRQDGYRVQQRNADLRRGDRSFRELARRSGPRLPQRGRTPPACAHAWAPNKPHALFFHSPLPTINIDRTMTGDFHSEKEKSGKLHSVPALLLLMWTTTLWYLFLAKGGGGGYYYYKEIMRRAKQAGPMVSR